MAPAQDEGVLDHRQGKLVLETSSVCSCALVDIQGPSKVSHFLPGLVEIFSLNLINGSNFGQSLLEFLERVAVEQEYGVFF